MIVCHNIQGVRTYGKAKVLCYEEVDEEYRTTLINFGKYKLIMFAMAKIMEMETTEQNKVALYLFNCINSKITQK